MRSMTGFGRGQGRSKDVQVVAEIKTVNHKYHDLSMKFPGTYQFLEPEVRDLILSSVSRGKVDCFLKDLGPSANRHIEVDEEMLAGYLKAARGAAKKFKLKGELPVEALLRMPDVLKVVEKERPEADMKKAVKEAVAAALAALDKMRSAEGARLVKDLTRRSDEIRRLAASIKERHQKAVTDKVKTLREKVSAFLPEPLVDQIRLATEEGVLLQRHDISEELTRLASHVEALLEALKEKGSVGRRLDFLLQEMNREANTIGSKCSDAAMAHDVVRLKESLEQIREQIQNLE
jgi:uncharacterized protein (TIGR00255 family)